MGRGEGKRSGVERRKAREHEKRRGEGEWEEIGEEESEWVVEWV